MWVLRRWTERQPGRTVFGSILTSLVFGGASAIRPRPTRGLLGPENLGGTVAALQLRDAATGATYDALTPVTGYHQFWFAWSI
ncbi:MAG: hypothetical protein AAGA56_30060, partial [Myxococcota bacterium]